MAKLFPELVFIRGPQKGLRVLLTKTMNIVGRDRGCEVEIQDEYASRQHARIVIEGARIRLVNTSPNGTKINGKLIEQAVLNTGDVLGFGLECEAQIEPADSQAVPARPGLRGQPAQPTMALPRGQQPKGKEPVEVKPVEEPGEGGTSKKKLKKPPAIVWVGVYLLFIAGLVVLFQQMGKPEREDQHKIPYLSSKDIAEFLDKPLKETPNDHLASEELHDAIKNYEIWKTGTSRSSDLYRTFQCFKRALAYRGAEKNQFRPEDIYHPPPPNSAILVQTIYEDVRNELIERIGTSYRAAFRAEREGHWKTAREGFNSVRDMIDDDKDPIRKNVHAHLAYVNTQERRERERPGRSKW